MLELPQLTTLVMKQFGTILDVGAIYSPRQKMFNHRSIELVQIFISGSKAVCLSGFRVYSTPFFSLFCRIYIFGVMRPSTSLSSSSAEILIHSDRFYGLDPVSLRKRVLGHHSLAHASWNSKILVQIAGCQLRAWRQDHEEMDPPAAELVAAFVEDHGMPEDQHFVVDAVQSLEGDQVEAFFASSCSLLTATLNRNARSTDDWLVGRLAT